MREGTQNWRGWTGGVVSPPDKKSSINELFLLENWVKIRRFAGEICVPSASGAACLDTAGIGRKPGTNNLQ